jgi:hypothetical protein
MPGLFSAIIWPIDNGRPYHLGWTQKSMRNNCLFKLLCVAGPTLFPVTAEKHRAVIKARKNHAHFALVVGDSHPNNSPSSPSLALRRILMATIVETAPAAPLSSSRSAVSWASIFAGAVVAIATTLILIALGSGLGFAAASPWPGASPSVTTFAITAGIWLIVTQWLSAGLGGYIAGRLRTKWVGVHTDEVMFRDTAHGLLAWAVATVVIGAISLSITASSIGTASNATASVVSYAADNSLRSAKPNSYASDAVRAEVSRLLAHEGGLQGGDRDYLARIVSEQTGLPRAEAERRIEVADTSIRQAADKARKVTSAIGFFTALSMLIGAFIASVAAAYAGGLRDKHADL